MVPLIVVGGIILLLLSLKKQPVPAVIPPSGEDTDPVADMSVVPTVQHLSTIFNLGLPEHTIRPCVALVHRVGLVDDPEGKVVQPNHVRFYLIEPGDGAGIIRYIVVRKGVSWPITWGLIEGLMPNVFPLSMYRIPQGVIQGPATIAAGHEYALLPLHLGLTPQIRLVLSGTNTEVFFDKVPVAGTNPLKTDCYIGRDATYILIDV